MGYTYLLDNRQLAQGSAPPPNVQLPFDFVVLSAVEYQDVNIPGSEVLRVPLDDSGPPPTPVEHTLIRVAAHEVAQQVRNGQRVLVTCAQGRNRSGVIAGLALVELGMPREEAIRRIREFRNGLVNPHFHAMVGGRL
jgi:protein-tyrosine phosphatase